MHANDHGQAADAFTALVKLDPQGPLAGEAQFLIAESLFQAGKYAHALKLYERLAEDQSLGEVGQSRVFLHAGQCCNDLRQWDDARFWLSRLIRGEGASDMTNEAHYELAVALEGNGDLRQAAEHYQLAAQFDTLSGARSRLALGALYAGQERYARALREFLTLMYGYGSADHQNEVRELQAQAGWAAAKAAARTPQSSEEDTQVAQARVEKLLKYVIDTHPQSEWAVKAKSAMDQIAVASDADEAWIVR